MAAAGQAVRLAVVADLLTLDAESGGLQGDKADVREGRAIQSLAKHNWWILTSMASMSAVEGNDRVKTEKVTVLVPRVENRIENAALWGMQKVATFHPSTSSQRACGAGVSPLFLAGDLFHPEGPLCLQNIRAPPAE